MGQQEHEYRVNIGEFIESYRGERAFRVNAHLGAGGMGEVYDVVDRDLGRRYALKLMSRELVGYPELRARFEQEGRLLAWLECPNIVYVHGIGETSDGAPYILMDRLHGETLREAINHRGSFALSAILRFGRDIAFALAHLHSVSFVHSDVKPSNIFLQRLRDGSLRPILIDFGISARISTQERPVGGTFRYASPEQKRGDPNVGIASDIYSYGLTLYVMLIGRTPSRSSDGTPEPICHLIGNPVAGPMLDILLRSMVAENPAERPSALDVARQLAEIQSVLGYRLAGQPSRTEKFVLMHIANQPPIPDEHLRPWDQLPNAPFLCPDATTRSRRLTTPQDGSSHSSVRTPASPAMVASAVLAGASGLVVPIATVPDAPVPVEQPVPGIPVVFVGKEQPNDSSTPSESSANKTPSVSRVRERAASPASRTPARPAPHATAQQPARSEHFQGKMAILPGSAEDKEAAAQWNALRASFAVGDPSALQDILASWPQPKVSPSPKVPVTAAAAADNLLSKRNFAIFFVVVIVLGGFTALFTYVFLAIPAVSLPAPSVVPAAPPAPVPSAPPAASAAPSAAPSPSAMLPVRARPPASKARPPRAPAPPPPAPASSEKNDNLQGAF